MCARADDHQDDDIHALEQRLAQRDAIAVGECGLDHFIRTLDRGRQQQLFEAQLSLARQFDLPVIVHARRAVQAVIDCIRRVGSVRGVIHSYGGSVEQARELQYLDFMIGVGGPYTWQRAKRLHQIAREVPLEQLLLETDAPDQPDAEWQGKRNEPMRLVAVLETIAMLCNTDQQSLAKASRLNAESLFQFN